MSTTKPPTLQLSDGRSMPCIGLGTFNFFKDVFLAVKEAIDVGYRHFDTAFIYGSEKAVGQAIRAKITDGTVKRGEVFLTSKLWITQMEPSKIETHCRASLEELGMNYIDLYLIHFPIAATVIEGSDLRVLTTSPALKFSTTANYTEVWKEMENLVDKGLVKSIGVSNFSIEQIDKLLKLDGLRHKPVTVQVEITPVLDNEDLVEYCHAKGITVTAYGPLGSQLQTNEDGAEKPKMMDSDIILHIAEKHGKTPAQIMLRWGIQRGYAVIPKSITPSRIKENFQIFDFTLDDEDMKQMKNLNQNFRIYTFSKTKHHPEHPYKND